MTTRHLLFRLTIPALILAVVVVVLGAFTRLVDAGLGCPDWPTCYGHLWIPTTDEDVATANAKFSDAPVEHDKTWPEQIHRIFASTLGLFALAIFLVSWRHRESGRPWRWVAGLLFVLVVGTFARMKVGQVMELPLALIMFAYFFAVFYFAKKHPGELPFYHPAFLVGLVILQGLFGMWTVTLLLWPQIVTAHLLGGFATLGVLWILLQRLSNWRWHISSGVDLVFVRKLVAMVLILVIIQITLGGWTSTNYAALACPDFPKCQNQWWPSADFVAGFNFLQTIGPNYLGGLLESDARTAIHFAHRLGAVVVTLACIYLAYQLIRLGFAQATRMAMIVLAVLAAQLTLGILNIVLSLPLFIAVMHNAVGATLLLVILTLCHRVYTAQIGE